MRGYMTISDDDKNSILQQHSSFYNGYSVGNVPSGPQPLRQDNGPSDINGITVNNRGEVGQYKNHLVNESVLSEKEDKWIQDVDMDEGSFSDYCGGEVTCDCVEKAKKEGGKASKQAQLYLNMNSDKCKSLQEYAADDMDVSDVDAAYDFESGGPEQFEDEVDFPPTFGDEEEDFSYSDDSYGMDIDSIMSMFDGSVTADLDDEFNGEEEYEDEAPAYEFDSEGAMDVDLYEEEQCEGCGGEMYEEKETCNECGGEMYEGECMECGGMYEEMDDDLKESFKKEKERISEMFDRFKKFN